MPLSLWIEARLFYHSDQDRALTSAVGPLIFSLEQAHLARHFFFLRYWNGGPHLRVRIRVTRPCLLDRVADQAKGQLEFFLEKSPSQYSLSGEMYMPFAKRLARLESEVLLPLVGDNELRFENYTPELLKYGGLRGLALAHNIFEASSRLTLRQLELYQGNKRKKLGAALVALLIALRIFLSTKEKAFIFLESYRDYWQPRIEQEGGAMSQLSLEQAGGALSRVCVAIFNRGNFPMGFTNWSFALQSAERFTRTSDSICTTLAKTNRLMPVASIREFLLMNYIHTHFNRLGLLPVEEAYLASAALNALQSAAMERT